MPHAAIAPKNMTQDLREIGDWLLENGQRYSSIVELLDSFAAELLVHKLPIARIRLTTRTLHPELIGQAYTWTQRAASKEMRAAHSTLSSEAYLGSPIQTLIETQQEVHQALHKADLSGLHIIFSELHQEGYGDYFGVPLFFSDSRPGACVFCSPATVLYSDHELAKLRVVARMLSPYAELFSTHQIAAGLLDTYLGHRTGQKVLNGMVKRGDAEIIRAALWFSDLRNFTQHSEHLTPHDLLAMLNSYFEFVAAAVSARGGEILRFIGDAMLIVFPIELHGDDASACTAALDAALDAFASLATLNHRRHRKQQAQIQFGVGLHIGDVIYGNVGAPNRLDFTVMGTSVNRTARLESLTKTIGRQLLMSARFANLIRYDTKLLGEYPMKGVVGLQPVYGLSDTAY